jgi:hypothetical protein
MPIAAMRSSSDPQDELLGSSEFVVLAGGPADLRVSLLRHEPNGRGRQIACTPPDAIIARNFMGPHELGTCADALLLRVAKMLFVPRRCSGAEAACKTCINPCALGSTPLTGPTPFESAETIDS